MSFDVIPLRDEVGVEVVGLELGRPVGDSTRQDLYTTWLDAGIVLFRGLGTTPEQHLELSRCFGELEVHPVEAIRLEGHPEIISLNNRGAEKMVLHYFDDEPIEGHIPWHSDLSYMPALCRGALLRMIETPARGGQTGWIDTAAAYDALPDATKERIDGLEARFEFVADICEMRFGRPEKLRHGDMGTTQYPVFAPVAHPLVLTHAESGRKSLNVSPVQLVSMVDMAADAGDALLEELVAHTTCGRFEYVHEWEVDDMVLWDNWRTLHKAFGVPPACEREVQRTTLLGDLPTGRIL